MKNLVRRFLSFYNKTDKYIFYSIIAALAQTSAIWLLFWFNYKKLPSMLPLFYSLPWGDPQLVHLNQFIIVPSIIVLIVLVNLILSWHLHPSQIILKRILSLSSAIVAFLFLVTAFKIIFIFI